MKLNSIFVFIIVISAFSGCLGEQEKTRVIARTPAEITKENSQDAIASEIATYTGQKKDEIYRKRLKKMRSENAIKGSKEGDKSTGLKNDEKKEAFSLIDPPGIFLADGYAIADITQIVFGKRPTLTTSELKALGKVHIINGRKMRLKTVTQEYLKVLRSVFYPKCTDLVRSELISPPNNNSTKLVDTLDNLSAEKVSSFMTRMYRTPPTSGELHDGAKEYSETFNNIVAENPAENREDLYSTICLAIATDPRTYIR